MELRTSQPARVSRPLGRALALATLALAIWLAVGPAVAALPVHQSGATIRITPATQTIDPLATTTFSVLVENVVNLYGAEFHLSFNQTLLEVVDTDSGTPGVQIQPGPFLSGGYTVNASYNISGTINYATTLLAPAAPKTGSGVIAIVTVRGRGYGGTSPIIFTGATLVDNLGNSIPLTLIADGEVVVNYPPTSTFTPTPTVTATPTNTNTPTATATHTNTPAPSSTFTPMSLPTVTPFSERWRFGAVLDPNVGPITAYDIARICLGWYNDRRSTFSVARPEGVEYVQVVRVGPSTWAAERDLLAAKAAALPGMLWLIGHEPDNPYQDNRTPGEYAAIYHEAYGIIKGADPTAQVANGPIAQGTELRVQWLDAVWHAYQTQYGVEMPVDVWAMHNYMMRERVNDWGCSVPPGIAASEGALYSIQDADNMTYFAAQIIRVRQWMKDHGQQSKQLLVSEYGIQRYGIPQFDPVGFTVDRINEFMTASMNWLLYTTDASLGMPGDGDRLVQRWAWLSLNEEPRDWLYTQPTVPGSGGALFDWQTGAITRHGLRYAALACNPGRPTPTPSSTPRSFFTHREAEDGSIWLPMRIYDELAASACQYVGGTPGERNGVTAVSFFVPERRDYVFWGRVRPLDYHNDMFNVRVDNIELANGSTYARWDLPTGHFGEWQWVQVSNSLTGHWPEVWTLNRGWHTLYLMAMDGGQTEIDLIQAIPRFVSYVPGPSAVTPCVPTPAGTPTDTPTPTVTPTPTATSTPFPSGPGVVNGHVAYQGHGTPPTPWWQQPLHLTVHLPGDPAPAYSFWPVTDASGNFSVTGVYTGTYDVYVRDEHSLRNLRRNVYLDASSPPLDMGLLLEGDCNTDGSVNIHDFSILSASYRKSLGEPGYDYRADLNDDDTVGIHDFSLLSANYRRSGDNVLSVAPKSGGWDLAPASFLEPPRASSPGAAALADMVVRFSPTSSSASRGQNLVVYVLVDANGNTYNAVEALIHYNPAYFNVSAGDVERGTAFSQWLPPTPAAGGGLIDVGTGGSSTPITSNGVRYAKITLHVRNDAPYGATQLTLSGCTASYEGGNVPCACGGAATVTIIEATPVPGPTQTPVPDPSWLVTTFSGDDGTLVDAYFDPANPTTAYGSQGRLIVRAGNNKAALFRAQLEPRIPVGSTVHAARLITYNDYSGSREMRILGYQLLAPWQEYQTTWISRTTALAWGEPGANLAGTDVAATPAVDRTIFAVGAESRYPWAFDVTTLVQAWVNDPGSNHGLVLRGQSEVSQEYAFMSREHFDARYRPLLWVAYSPPTGDTPTPTATPEFTPTPTATGDVASPTPSITPTPGPTSTPMRAVYTPVADSYLNQWDKDANYGGSGSLRLRPPEKRPVFRFDLSQIPTGSLVTSAVFRCCKDDQTAGLNVGVYALHKDWTELGGRPPRRLEGAGRHLEPGPPGPVVDGARRQRHRHRPRRSLRRPHPGGPQRRLL